MTALFVHPFTCPYCGNEVDADDDDLIYRNALVIPERTTHVWLRDENRYGDRTTAEFRETRCVDCYTNPVCPDSCSAPHDGPANGERGVRTMQRWECPETGAEFMWCDECESWEPVSDENAQAGDVWLCDPYSHDYRHCDDCNTLRYYDDLYSDEYGDYLYCRSCYQDRQSEDEYDDGESVWAPEPVLACDVCGVGSDLTFDPLTERHLCSAHTLAVAA